MENTDIVIENTTATWTIPPETSGEILGTYAGTFNFRCYLTPTQELQAGREYRALLGPNGVLAGEHEAQMAYCLTQLKHRIITSPPFWTGHQSDDGQSGNIPDLRVLLLILDAAMRSEQLFKNKVKEEREARLKASIEIAEKRVKENALEE